MRTLSLLFVLCTLFFTSTEGALGQSFQTPEQTLETYLEACEQGNFEAAQTCYTKSSRELSQAQEAQAGTADPEMLRQTYERLKDVDFKLEQVNAKRAILWPGDESIPPFLFRIQEPSEAWRLDYHFMSNYIKVNEKGWSWRDPRILGLWKKRE